MTVEAKRHANWSLIMFPCTLGSAVFAGLLEMWILSARGLEGSEPLSQQGAWGYAVLIIGNLGILLVPAYFGLYFGAKSLREGAGKMGWLGAALNSIVIAIVWVAVVRSVFGA